MKQEWILSWFFKVFKWVSILFLVALFILIFLDLFSFNGLEETVFIENECYSSNELLS